MDIQFKGKDKGCIFFEWRKIGSSVLTTIQYEDGEGQQRSSHSALLRVRITSEEAALGDAALREKYPCPV